ncbi:F-box domain containing protein [Tanacetum coccineum]
MPLGDHAAHWSSYIEETQFDLRPHMESPNWTEIEAGIQQHLQKVYNTNKAAFKAQHWWDKYIQFWNDPRNIARAAQNRQNRAKSTVISRQGSWSLARLRDKMRQSSATQEYPSLIDTFFVAHTVNGEFTRDEDRLIYEMRRLEATGTYTDDEINRLTRRGKQRGHILGVGRVLPARVTASPKFESGGASGSGGCGDNEKSADDQEDEDGDGDVDSADNGDEIGDAADVGETMDDDDVFQIGTEEEVIAAKKSFDYLSEGEAEVIELRKRITQFRSGGAKGEEE